MSFIQCPHCGQFIEILQINCGIFRCGILKDNFQQIDPHLNKESCDKLFAEDKIFGCSKPFRIIEGGKIEICDYI